MLTLPEELRAAVKEAGNEPLHLIHPETKTEFLLVPAASVQVLDMSPLTQEEQQYLLVQVGLRAGWDDPEMDVYNDLDPRSETGGSTCQDVKSG